MEEKKIQPKKLSLSNTKQEMLEAYHTVLKQLEAQREAELKPEKKLEEKKAREVIQVAESLSSEGIAKEISNLKIETGKMLAQISDRLEEEVNKFGVFNDIENMFAGTQCVFSEVRAGAVRIAFSPSP